VNIVLPVKATPQAVTLPGPAAVAIVARSVPAAAVTVMVDVSFMLSKDFLAADFDPADFST
jgi:hypothetical protein